MSNSNTPTPIAERKDAITSLREENLTLQEIADKFGLTRERIRQIVLAERERGLGGYQALRRQENIGIIEETIGCELPAVLVRRCALCGTFDSSQRYAGTTGRKKASAIFCTRCRKLISVMASLAYRASACDQTYQSISTAAYLIRKHKITKEKFRVFFLALSDAQLLADEQKAGNA